MKYFNQLLLIILFSASGLLYSEQTDSLKNETNVTTLKQDSTLKDSAKVDESYHLIGYLGCGVGYPRYSIINIGLEIPFTYENYISFVLNLSYLSDNDLLYAPSGLIKFNPSISEKFYFSFCIGIGVIPTTYHFYLIYPLVFSISYSFDKCFTLSLLLKGEKFIIIPPSLSLNLYFKI